MRVEDTARAMTIHRRLPILFAVVALSACSTGAADVAVGDTAVSTDGAGSSGPLGTVGIGVAAATATATVETAAAPSAPPDAGARFVGAWTLARSGDRVCTVELAARTAAGARLARTRLCRAVELARIAAWAPAGDGVVLYDFDDRPVVALAAVPGGAFEGATADGIRLTLWR